jgi:hypothetical protein
LYRNFLSDTGSSRKDNFGNQHIHQRRKIMTIDRMVLAFAGSFILISLLLFLVHSHYWLWFTAFVGANLLQSSFTGFCPLAIILKFFGVKEGAAFK